MRTKKKDRTEMQMKTVEAQMIQFKYLHQKVTTHELTQR